MPRSHAPPFPPLICGQITIDQNLDLRFHAPPGGLGELEIQPSGRRRTALDHAEAREHQTRAGHPAGQRAEPQGRRGPENLPDVNSHPQFRRRPFPFPRVSVEIYRSQAVRKASGKKQGPGR